MRPDFSPTAADYLRYRRPFPPELYARLGRLGIGMPGQRVLDLGAGTGLFGRGLTARGCRVVDCDSSESLLTSSQAAARVIAQAEAIPFGDESFDLISAAQCWHWFDRRLAPREVRRVLRPGGWLAVVYQMYVPLPGEVAEATERLMLKHRPGWRHAGSAGINGQVLRDVQSAGFTGIESFSFDTAEAYSRDDWRGFVRTCSAVGGSLAAEKVAAFDRDHQQMLEDWPQILEIPFRVFTAVARKPLSRL